MYSAMAFQTSSYPDERLSPPHQSPLSKLLRMLRGILLGPSVGDGTQKPRKDQGSRSREGVDPLGGSQN